MLSPDLITGTVTFTASRWSEFTYTVSDGPQAVVGVVRGRRFDEHAAPVAEDDIAILPSGGSRWSPLASDTDPSGGILSSIRRG